MVLVVVAAAAVGVSVFASEAERHRAVAENLRQLHSTSWRAESDVLMIIGGGSGIAGAGSQLSDSQLQSIRNLIGLYDSYGNSEEAQKYRDMLPDEEKNAP